MVNLDKSVVDPRVRRYVQPARVIWQSKGATAPEGAENLLATNGAPYVMPSLDTAPDY